MAPEDEGAPRAAVPRGELGAPASDADEVLAFLAELASALHSTSTPAHIVEARIREAARALGLEVETFTLQSLVLVGRRGRGGAHVVRTEFSPHWNLRRLHELVALADAIASGDRALPSARADLQRIQTEPPQYRKSFVLLCYVIYGAAVAGRVGGGPMELLVAALVGVVAGAIHLGTLAHPIVELQKSFLAAFLGALAGFLLSLVLPPFDASRAIFGAMTLLVPAIVITTAALELASEAAVEAGVARLAYGLFRFLMMGTGLIGAAILWSLLGPAPAAVAATPLPFFAVAALLVVGGAALVPCLQARPRDTPWIVLAVLLAWGTQELTKVLFGGHGGAFAAALVLGVAGLLYGRRPGKNPATVLFPGLLQIAPGFLGTRAVLASLRPGAAPGTESFFDVLVVTVQLVLGLVVASVVVRGRGAPPGTAGRREQSVRPEPVEGRTGLR
jgi:uncharacterized membrane protein YjjP (DUF1212 family)